MVVHGQMGLLVEDENVKALAEARKFIHMDPAAAVQIGREGKCRAMKRFSWDRYVDAYDSLYRRLIAGEQTETVSQTAMSQRFS